MVLAARVLVAGIPPTVAVDGKAVDEAPHSVSEER